MAEVAKDLRDLATDLDQRHRQQRKTQFLLDARGYLIVNGIVGTYVEFGLYRGEMMYSAHHILDKVGCFTHYVGLDSFSGEPGFSQDEQKMNPYLEVGDYAASFEQTFAFLAEAVGRDRLTLIRGDFRDASVRQEARTHRPFAMTVIDCNMMSAIEAALDESFAAAAPGSMLFVDDLFANLGNGRPATIDAITAAASHHRRRIEPYQTYPPCARAFVVL